MKTKALKPEAELLARADALLPLRPVEMEILLILGDAPLHAYAIAKAAEESGETPVGLGSLYRTLNRLRSDGLIEEDTSGARDVGPQNQARRPWSLTELGRVTTAREAQRLQRVVASARARRFLAGERK